MQVVPHQGDVRRLAGRVGAAAHGDADVGGGQGRRVVDAVADHGDDTAGGAQLGDSSGFVGGQQAGAVFVNAASRRYGRRHLGAVAGQHHDADALLTQGGHGAGGVGAHGVGNGDDAQNLPSVGDKQRRLPLRRHPAGGGVPVDARVGGNGDAVLRQQVGVADDNGPAVNASGYAGALLGGEIGCRRRRQSLLLSVAHYRPADRMLGKLFQRHGAADDGSVGNPGGGGNGDDGRLPVRQGAGFVHGDGVHRMGAFQCSGVSQQDAPRGAAPDADDDGRRRGQAQGAGAGDDEYGDQGEHGVLRRGVGPQQQPGCRRRQGD